MAIANLRKAAAFLSSLPKQQAAGLLAALTPEQAAAVSAEMAAAGPIGREEQEAVKRELAASDSFRRQGHRNGDCPNFRVSENGTVPFDADFEFLDGLGPDDLLALIGEERPPTIALILSGLPAPQAAEVIAMLPADQQAAVIGRIATMQQPSEEILSDVADGLRQRLTGPVRVPVGRGMARVVKMFGAMPPAAERKLLGDIAEADPDLLWDIRRAMFGEDVAACADAELSGVA